MCKRIASEDRAAAGLRWLAPPLLTEARRRRCLMAIRAPKLRLLCSIALSTILLGMSAASAEPPRPAGSATDDLRWHLDQVLATAQTPSFRALDPVGRRAEVRRIVGGLFD